MPSCQCRLKAWEGGEGGWDDDLSYRIFIETLYLGEGPSTGMIVILLRSENCRFWSHLECLGWRVNIIVRQVLLRIPYKAKPDKKNKQTMLSYTLCCKKAFVNNVEFDINKKITIFLVLFYCLFQYSLAFRVNEAWATFRLGQPPPPDTEVSRG